MDDAKVLERVEKFSEAEINTQLRVASTDTGGVRSRSTYVHGDRLVITDCDTVVPDEVPDENTREGEFPAYLETSESYHRVDGEIEDPVRGDSPGWYAEESVEGVTTYMPVNEQGEVVRQAGNQPVPVFVLYQHYNFRPDLFEAGGVWEDLMEGGDA